MERLNPLRLLMAGMVAGAIAILAACASKPPPVEPPPVVRIPPRPVPPMGAPNNLPVPPLLAGMRHTINTNLSPEQATWNLRSAYNVAALNCTKPEHAPILTGYTNFLKEHAKTLKTVNNDLDKKFKADYGKSYVKEREVYQTQVYNYFALPPVMPAFCQAALKLTEELGAVSSVELQTYSMGGLARIDHVFQEFFNSYEQYKADLASWEAQYGAAPPLTISPMTDQTMAQ